LNLLRAVRSQIAQNPIVGSGFGTRVTTAVLVPGTPLIQYVQTYLFEWTYLDVIVKVGAIGLALLLLFCARIGLVLARHVRSGPPVRTLGRAGWAGLAAFLALNVTTPYLNHPLGWGTLALFVGVASSLNRLHPR
jgi:hypothetical protein